MEKKGIILEKLRCYLDKRNPDRKQQIYAHVMSMNARALIGYLFTPGLFEEKVDQIIGGSSGSHGRIREEKEFQEPNEQKEKEIMVVRENVMEIREHDGRLKEWKSPRGADGETYQIPGNKGSPGNRVNEGKRKKAVLRCGREGIESNEEWEYTIKVKKVMEG